MGPVRHARRTCRVVGVEFCVMAFTPGSRQAATMAAGWGVAALCTAASIAYFAEIQAVAHNLLGRPDANAPRVSAAEGERSGPSAGGRTVELKAGAYGHFHARAEVNGRPISVMVDTGASMVALSFEDAREAGLHVRDSDFTHRVSTANGYARIAPVIIDRISVGDITVRNVSGAVMEPGKLGTTLLGMSFLSRLQRVDIRSGMLVLQE
jgi:aspartyl protease family protein